MQVVHLYMLGVTKIYTVYSAGFTIVLRCA